MQDRAEIAVRNERILSSWAAGMTAPEIGAMLNPCMDDKAVFNVLRRARHRGDVRAVKRLERAEPENIDAIRSAVLDDWFAGLYVSAIATKNSVRYSHVNSIIERARVHGDPRAVKRRPGKAQPVEPEDQAVADWHQDSYNPFVPLAPLKFLGAEGLRSVALSVRDHASPRGSLTASLMGDPTPERSALRREIKPHEYASGGEGRYRDRSFNSIWEPHRVSRRVQA